MTDPGQHGRALIDMGENPVAHLGRWPWLPCGPLLRRMASDSALFAAAIGFGGGRKLQYGSDLIAQKRQRDRD